MITKPTLILDEKRCRENIREMFLKAEKNGVGFRPHFKTHQSLEIGRWFRELGADKITVSSLEMARYFSPEWNDITVAFPVNVREIETINELAGRIGLNLLLEAGEAAEFLRHNLKHPVGFFIKIDVGYHRTGLDPRDLAAIDRILGVSDKTRLLKFKGFLTHAGHSYDARGKEEILQIHRESQNLLNPLKARYLNKYPDLLVSVGDTPTCSVADDFSGFDEIRPGNFVFYDLCQNQIGSCGPDRIAVALACPVVSLHRERNELVIYGGGVHFSKERMNDDDLGTIFGKVVEKTEDGGWGEPIPGMFVKSLSQEHGIITGPESEIARWQSGDYLLVLPVHSCMTANLLKSYRTTEDRLISRL
ncbi:MAG: alanine racemase [Pyrinomonadaceae bacterium]